MSPRVYSPRVCAIVPSYNHDQVVGEVVASLRDLGLPVFVVDDGSGPATAATLAALHDRARGICVTRLPVNRGKGQAVREGFRLALDAGFTHALQIDADGQHDLAAVPRMLELAQRHPDALVSGQAVFDRTAPIGRRIGRWVTHFWVCVETMSFRVTDSMCGLRVYPLRAAIGVADAQPVGSRMDFDTAILVRMCWCGVPVVTVPVRVSYPPGNTSNFRLWRDNLRITWMHTRLVLAMPARLISGRIRRPCRPAQATPKPATPEPATPAQATPKPATPEPATPAQATPKPATPEPATPAQATPEPATPEPATPAQATPEQATPAQATHWASLAELGVYFGIRFCVAVYRLIGRRGCLVVMAPIVAYYYLTAGDRRRASRRFLQHAFVAAGMGRRPNRLDGLRHFMRFAASILDSFIAWTGGMQRDAIQPADCAALDAFARDPRGGVLIVGHLGNTDISRAWLDPATRARLLVLMHTDHAENYNRVLREFSPDVAVNVFQVTDMGPDMAISLRDHVDRGRWIVIAGDRTPVRSQGRVARVPFMGALAPFSQGPYVLAALMECPVWLLFCRKVGGRYRLVVERFAEQIVLPRGERNAVLAGHAAHYAARLQAHAIADPFQWYNFFDFWAG